MRVKWAALALFLWGSSAAVAVAAPGGPPFRLCVLDQATLVQHSRLAQTMGTHFQQIRRQAQDKIEDDRRTLEADARALDGLRSSIPAAVAKMRDADIARRRLELKERGEQTNRNLAALDAELTSNVVKAAEPTVRVVEAERGCSMLVGSTAILHLRDASLDITPAVIDRMNTAPASPPNPAQATDTKGR